MLVLISFYFHLISQNMFVKAFILCDLNNNTTDVQLKRLWLRWTLMFLHV